MTVEVRVVDGGVLVRAAGWWRWSGIAFAVVWGALFVVNVIGGMADGDWLAAVAAGTFGLGGLHWILAMSAASVEARADGLRVRAGLLRRRVASGDVEEIRVVGPTFQSQFVLGVIRTNGRPRRLQTIRQVCTQKNRRALEDAGSEVARALDRA